MSTTNRNDVKQLAQQIENLAREVQSKVDTGGDLIVLSEELVRNNIAFIFTIGEVFALERANGGKPVTAKTVSNPTTHNYRNNHNVRDSYGRFTRKV